MKNTIKTANVFNGKPNGTYKSINQLFEKNPSLLLESIGENKYKIIRIYETPNKCLLRLRQLNKINNKYKIHSNI